MPRSYRAKVVVDEQPHHPVAIMFFLMVPVMFIILLAFAKDYKPEETTGYDIQAESSNQTWITHKREQPVVPYKKSTPAKSTYVDKECDDQVEECSE